MRDNVPFKNGISRRPLLNKKPRNRAILAMAGGLGSICLDLIEENHHIPSEIPSKIFSRNSVE